MNFRRLSEPQRKLMLEDDAGSPVDPGIREPRNGCAFFDADQTDAHAVQRLSDLDADRPEAGHSDRLRQ
ncbi:MAG: hypothetical protein P8Z31_03640 [Gammaproteobacteria bacterium]